MNRLRTRFSAYLSEEGVLTIHLYGIQRDKQVINKVVHVYTSRLCGSSSSAKKNNYILSCLEQEDKKKSDFPITLSYFEQFWKLYPRKAGKGQALKSWTTICNRPPKKRPTWLEIKKALHDQIKSELWKDKVIPHPSTWLNQNRWLNDASEMKSFKKDSDIHLPKYWDGVQYNWCEDGMYRSKSGKILPPD